MQIWVHGDRDALASNDGTAVMVWDKGTKGFSSSSCVWQLGAGNQDSSNMDGANINTVWDSTAHVRYSISNADAVNGTDDYVWIQISIDVPDGATAGSYSGTIWVNVKASTT